MSSWSELEDIESAYVTSIDTWKVSGASSNTLGLISVDNKRSLSHNVSAVSELSNAMVELLGSSDLGEVITSTEVLQSVEKRLGIWESKVVDDQREFWNIFDVMTSGQNEWGACRSSESRGDGMSPLGYIDLSVPFSPYFEWSEHSGFSAHVTKCGLS